MRERRCILEACCFAALAAAVAVPTMAVECLVVVVAVGGDEEDMGGRGTQSRGI